MTTMAYKKKLIEVAIPLEAINFAAMKEKDNPFLKGHPRALHQWFARRPLPTCRAILFAQMVDDPSSDEQKFPTEEEQAVERERLFRLMQELVIWENMTNQSVIDKAIDEIKKSSNGRIPDVLDPFSGGGAIPFEAQRLGAQVFAGDLNPVAVAINKAMVDLPARFNNQKPIHPGLKEALDYRNASGLIEDIRWYGKKLKDTCETQLIDLYPTCSLPPKYGSNKEAKIIGWVWARAVPSPDPSYGGAYTPLSSSFVLCKKKGKEACVIPKVNGNKLTFDVLMSPTKNQMENAKSGTKSGRGANFNCLFSGAAITQEYVRQIGSEKKIKNILIAVVVDGGRKRIYLGPDAKHEEIEQNIVNDKVPSIVLPNHPQYVGVRNYGYEKFEELFSNRQLKTLITLSSRIKDIVNLVERDAKAYGLVDDGIGIQNDGRGAKAYAESIGVYLAFAVDKLADYGNTLCGWSNSNENVVHLFNRHALPILWDFFEANPFGPMMDFNNIVRSVSSGLNSCVSNKPGNAYQANASEHRVESHNLVISSDPPYYDNVPYADISDFFYLWLQNSLKDFIPDLFETLSAPKNDEIVADRIRHGSPENAEKFFLERMRAAINLMGEMAHKDYPFTLYYAFKQTEIEVEGVSSTGWATFLQSIIDAGCKIEATWPVRTESQTRKRAVSSNALATSVVLVCRTKDEQLGKITRAEFIRLLRDELPAAKKILKLANISPADIPQSSIGPGISIFSRYQAVLEADDSPMSVKTALQLINRELGEEEGDYDAETSFALTWFEQNGFNVGDFGTANNLATAKGIAVNALVYAGIAQSSGGKFSLLNRASLEEGWDPAADSRVTIWECCQYLIRRLENRGEAEAAKLMRAMGSDRAESAKELAYALYDIAANKRRDATEATAYNGLIAVWSELTTQAANMTDADLRGDGQGQLI